MEAVAAGRGPAVLVANGTEGEPLSGKDRALLVGNPHLALDGIAAATTAVGATRCLLAVERARPDTAAAVRRALAERPDPLEVELVLTPSRYVVGQETALVHWIDNRDARPVFGARPFEKGVGGRPTLIDNVETLAHIGLIARFGPDWFRAHPRRRRGRPGSRRGGPPVDGDGPRPRRLPLSRWGGHVRGLGPRRPGRGDVRSPTRSLPAPSRGLPAGPGPGGLAVSRFRLVLDPTACDGHGICAELFPEGIGRDDWGFPVVTGEVPDDQVVHARRAASACPVLALRMVTTA